MRTFWFATHHVNYQEGHETSEVGMDEQTRRLIGIGGCDTIALTQV